MAAMFLLILPSIFSVLTLETESQAPFFSDGYESGDYSSWNGIWIDGYSTLETVSAISHHGTKSSHSITNPGSSRAYAYKVFTQQADVYTRLYVYFDTVPTVKDGFFLILEDSAGKVAKVSGHKTGWRLKVQGTAGDVDLPFDEIVNPDQWYCIELRWKKQANGQGEAYVWRDGTEIINCTGKDFDEEYLTQDVLVGLRADGEPGSAEVYVDCVAVSDSRIGLESHDVAIEYVEASRTVVGKGYCMTIETMIKNQGHYTETFNVTVYANSTIIDKVDDITLENNSSTNLTITWNTTDFTEGSYTVSVFATIVQGETDTADNTNKNGIVTLTIPGDINGDFKCNVEDLFMLAKVYGSTSNDPAWNPNIDINCDNKVDYTDLLILSQNYEEHDQ
jgi:hypothetical protein